MAKGDSVIQSLLSMYLLKLKKKTNIDSAGAQAYKYTSKCAGCARAHQRDWDRERPSCDEYVPPLLPRCTSLPQKAIMPWLLGGFERPIWHGTLCVFLKTSTTVMTAWRYYYSKQAKALSRDAARKERESSVMRLARLPRSLLANPMWAAVTRRRSACGVCLCV